ncbi:MBL fold metallo-hydrolase [Okibacterium fritillariae]|uniref:L-ascorbate metabolism protein UlaG, beta-lactamase superfamily n=1 Tax=Okibacterium fritillariae TaxID=123320 RepID=A0A1T5J5Z8_9MICO|nr:MBL fold metallo-hydrolase [Okibacterium fritillariae]SKC46722.1 L-ascorbate metabolism protein UlaG, beta-lactamase superfamily [Okibacterium fritillariae]
MRLTKLEHAGLLLEDTNKKLFVDPGMFTTPLTEVANTLAIVITHEHPDHWTPEQIERIVSKNPDVQIFGPAGLAQAAPDLPINVVQAGDAVEVGPFRLRFFGGKHAVIHSSIPVIDNVGVLVNDTLFYGGDALDAPEGIEVDLLAAPVGAPWLKIGEAIDYVLAVKPKRTFPVHEMVLSKAGKDMGNDRLKWATEQGGGEYFAVQPNESLDL